MSRTFRSLVELLEYRAAHTPHAVAYTFLADGEVETETFTYGALAARAKAIAVSLQQQGVRPGDRALLLFPPGLDFIAAFFGALYGRAVPVPCYPPHPAQLARSLPRLLAIAADAEPAAVLCSADILQLASSIAHSGAALGGVRWVCTDAVDDDAGSPWRRPDVDETTLAFLQYTSGSTASPRGVMVSHGNLLHNLTLAAHCAQNDVETRSVSWLPVVHDMGLIEGVLGPLFGEYPAYLMSPASFLQRPIRWLGAISRYRATKSGGPNFAYDLCVRKTTPEQRLTLDLSSWRVAYNGAEPIRADTLEAFLRAFEPCGFQWSSFYPVYGLAEATLAVSSGRRDYEPVIRSVSTARLRESQVIDARTDSTATRLVASGPAAYDTRIVIVDPITRRRCPDGSVGEIWIASPSVTQGYWRRPHDSAHVFGARLADDNGGPYLRSGDLGTIICGELFVVGRLKDVLIVRGLKHHPQDIERTAERQHHAIRPGCTAAFAVDSPEGARIVVASEIDARRLRHEITPKGHPYIRKAISEITRAVRHAVASEHGIQLHGFALLLPGNLPKTTSGKIRRHACADAWMNGSLDHIARWHDRGERSDREDGDLLVANIA
jgi:acyl-CoA synthetase (AMP-forming)/AMP-acid ligase II